MLTFCLDENRIIDVIFIQKAAFIKKKKSPKCSDKSNFGFQQYLGKHFQIEVFDK